jgi:hypothetical protein
MCPNKDKVGGCGDGVFKLRRLELVDRREVEAHLAGELRLEVLDLQVDHHEAPE